ncbi:MAG TPA: class I SAM-dependent methyltransferase [Candidatus Omnitrophota bacterium]|nr:class I SAM-dependent methyltransferase [Candidatus Omnitrophota bacterium]
MNSTKRDFDKEAASWDSPPRVKLAADVSKAILGQIQLKPDMELLDFGCGTGLVSFPLSSQVHSITGVDTSKGMLEVFEGKIKSKQVENIKTLHLDLEKGDTVSGRYHAIISSMTLHHVKDTVNLIRQFHRVLLPGGYIAIADLDEEGGRFHSNNDGVFHFGFDREKLCQLFVEAGFRDVSSATATQMNKLDSQGQDKVFSIFLITGRK